VEKLILDAVWPDIQKMASSSNQIHAAIAYFTSNKNLRFKAGDSLIVNASTAAISSGETSAQVLRQLADSGVALWSFPTLHAKLIVTDETVFVGSANASFSSENQLTEATLATNSTNVRDQALYFLHQLKKKSVHLTDAHIARLCKIPVKRRGRAPIRTNRKRIKAPGNTWWLAGVYECDLPKEQLYVEKVNAKIIQQHPSADPNWIRYGARAQIAKLSSSGDRLVVFSSPTKNSRYPSKVSPPCPVLDKQKTATWARLYYDPELSNPYDSLSWKEFQQRAKKAGIKRKITSFSTLALSSSEAVALEQLWSKKTSS
jgi:hypothetical protein